MFDVDRPLAVLRASIGWVALQLLLEVESIVHTIAFRLGPARRCRKNQIYLETTKPLKWPLENHVEVSAVGGCGGYAKYLGELGVGYHI